MQFFTVKEARLRGSPDLTIRQRQGLIYDIAAKTAVGSESLPLPVAGPSYQSAPQEPDPQGPFAVLQGTVHRTFQAGIAADAGPGITLSDNQPVVGTKYNSASGIYAEDPRRSGAPKRRLRDL